MRTSGLKVAPLRRRLAALVIDAAVFLTPAIAGGAGAAVLYMRWKGSDEPEREWSPPELSRRWQIVLFGPSLAVEIATRNWRGPGYRALGLRRVDLRTGGPVSIRSALTRSVATHSFTRLTHLLLRPWEERRDARVAAAHAEIEEVRRTLGEDREALAQEVMNVFERHDVNPASSCLLPLAGSLLPHLAAVFSPLRQTLWDRLAGTVVVED